MRWPIPEGAKSGYAGAMHGNKGKWADFQVPAGYEVWQAGYDFALGKAGLVADPWRPGSFPKGASTIGNTDEWRVPGVPPNTGVRGTAIVARGPIVIGKRVKASAIGAVFGLENRDDLDAINVYVLDMERKANHGGYPTTLAKLRPLFVEWKDTYNEIKASLYVSDADLKKAAAVRDKINSVTWVPYVDPVTKETVKTYAQWATKSADTTTSNIQRAKAAESVENKISPLTIAAIAVAGVGLAGGALALFTLGKPIMAAYSVGTGLLGGGVLYGVGKAGGAVGGALGKLTA